jgi:arabinose-5-phosphate isomerase
MTDKALGCLCIESNDKLAGIITDGDIRRTLNKYDDIRNLTINEIMTKNPISIQDNITLGEALSIMENRDSQINVLPVVDNDNNCIGVIRLHDIIKSGI